MTREARQTDFEHEGVRWTVYSIQLRTRDAVNVTLFGPGCEITVEALTHGEGMIMLADVMKSLGRRLALEALEKEGVFKNPNWRDR